MCPVHLTTGLLLPLPQPDRTYWNSQDLKVTHKKFSTSKPCLEKGGLSWGGSVWPTRHSDNGDAYSLPSACPDIGTHTQTCSSHALSTSQWQDISAQTLSYFPRNQTDFCPSQFIWSLPKEQDWHFVKCLGHLWKNLSSPKLRCQDESSPVEGFPHHCSCDKPRSFSFTWS